MNGKKVITLVLVIICIATFTFSVAFAATYTAGNVYQGLRLTTGQIATARASGTQDKYVTVGVTNHWKVMNLIGNWEPCSESGYGSGMGAANASAKSLAMSPSYANAWANVGGSILAVSGT